MMKSIPYVVLALLASLLVSCTERGERGNAADGSDAMTRAILEDTASFYYIDVKRYDASDPALPIGIFDSGTGGLTVMDALVRYDRHRNDSQEAETDGLPDFARETFIYLADQANMPYGNYYSENKSDLLIEHVLKDAQFLLSDKYYPEGTAAIVKRNKQPVKAIVVACNTATAYAKEEIETLIAQTGINMPVIGVIDAGAKGALEVFQKNESGTIGVFATVGTVASKGYENTILKMKDALGYTGDIQIYNQGGYGVAEAVDQEPGFIDYRANEPRTDYRGPALDHEQYPIDRSLLQAYRFDFTKNAMLCDRRQTDDCNILQLNSPANYVRYHLVSLLEQMRKAEDVQPLKALVLGCTHYPYLMADIRSTLNDLYNFRQGSDYVYRHLMQEQIHIVDPAENVATELHAYLKDHGLFNTQGSLDSSEFYISVPNLDNPRVAVDDMGRFTYDYKYGRTAGEIQEYIKVVPFSRKNIPAETIDRMDETIGETFRLIQSFSDKNPKMAALPEADKIK